MAGKNKLYAIHFKDGRQDPDIIVATWGECSELIKGAPNAYKGFATPAEAEEWLSSFKGSTASVSEGSKDKTYSFSLPAKYAEALDKELKIMNMTISEYLMDMIRTDLLDEDITEEDEEDEKLPF